MNIVAVFVHFFFLTRLFFIVWTQNCNENCNEKSTKKQKRPPLRLSPRRRDSVYCLLLVQEHDHLGPRAGCIGCKVVFIHAGGDAADLCQQCPL